MGMFGGYVPSEQSVRPTCCRCGEAPEIDGEGLCGHCKWAIKAEIESGLFQMHEYLGKWASFREWESHEGA